MSKDDAVCLEVGREIVRMIRDLMQTAGADLGYSRRKFSFPGGEVHLLMANSVALADRLEAGAHAAYDVQTVQKN